MKIIHLNSPVVVLGGKIAVDFLFQTPNSSNLSTGAKVFYAFCGICMMVAGFVNTFLLKVSFFSNFCYKVILKTKEKLKENNKLWISLAHLKLIISIFIFTPLMVKI